MDKKVKKGGASKKPSSGLPLIRIGRFLKKYGGPKGKAASRGSGPQYPLGILPPYVKPVGYIPPASQQSIYICRALQVLDYAQKGNMKEARGKVVG